MLRHDCIVVVGTFTIGDTPPRHGTLWIEFRDPQERANGLVVVKCECPHQALVKILLSLRRSGADRAFRGLPSRRIVELSPE